MLPSGLQRFYRCFHSSFPVVSGFPSAVAKANWGGGRRETFAITRVQISQKVWEVSRKKPSTTEITSERAELSGRAFQGREEHPGRGIPSSAPEQGGRERVQPRFGEAGRDEGASASSPTWSHLPAQPHHGTSAKLPPPAPPLPPACLGTLTKATKGTTVNPMPQKLFQEQDSTIPGLCFGELSTPSNARGVPVRVSCPGLEMPFPKAGWACLWGNFYLHKQLLGGQQGCGSARVYPYRQPRSEGNVNTDGWGGNAAAQRHPHCDGVLHHPVLLGAGAGSPGFHGRGGVQRGPGMSHTDRR